MTTLRKRNTKKMSIRGSHLNKVAQSGLGWSREGFVKEETHTSSWSTVIPQIIMNWSQFYELLPFLKRKTFPGWVTHWSHSHCYAFAIMDKTELLQKKHTKTTNNSETSASQNTLTVPKSNSKKFLNYVFIHRKPELWVKIKKFSKELEVNSEIPESWCLDNTKCKRSYTC